MNLLKFASLCAPIALGFLLQGIGIFPLIEPELLAGMRIPATWGVVLILHLPLLLYKHKWSRPGVVIAGLTIAQAATCALSWLGTEVRDYGRWKFNLFVTMAIAPSLLLLRLYYRREDLVRRLLGAIVVFSAVPVATIYGYMSMYGLGEFKWYMLSTREVDVIGLSRSLGVAAIICLYYFLTWRKIPQKLIAMLVLVVVLSGQLYLSERGPLLAIGLSITYFSFAFLRVRNRGGSLTKPYIVLPIVILQVLVIGVLPLLTERFSVQNILNDARMDIYRKAWTDVVSSGSPFGVGLGNFTYSISSVGARQYMHNIFGEILVETGLLGFCVILVFCLVAYRYIFASRSGLRSASSALAVVCSTLFVYAAANAQVSGDLGTNWMFWVFAALALCVADAKRQPEPRYLTPGRATSPAVRDQRGAGAQVQPDSGRVVRLDTHHK